MVEGIGVELGDLIVLFGRLILDIDMIVLLRLGLDGGVVVVVEVDDVVVVVVEWDDLTKGELIIPLNLLELGRIVVELWDIELVDVINGDWVIQLWDIELDDTTKGDWVVELWDIELELNMLWLFSDSVVVVVNVVWLELNILLVVGGVHMNLDCDDGDDILLVVLLLLLLLLLYPFSNASIIMVSLLLLQLLLL